MKVLKDGSGITATLKGAVKRLGEPVIRVAVGRAMKEMGAQFVLGQTIEEAVKRGAFGAPTFFVEDEMFFGHDRLPLLESHLRG